MATKILGLGSEFVCRRFKVKVMGINRNGLVLSKVRHPDQPPFFVPFAELPKKYR